MTGDRAEHGQHLGSSPPGACDLTQVRPVASAINDQLNNHGWILGGTDRLGWRTQASLDAVLEPAVR